MEETIPRASDSSSSSSFGLLSGSIYAEIARGFALSSDAILLRVVMMNDQDSNTNADGYNRLAEEEEEEEEEHSHHPAMDLLFSFDAEDLIQQLEDGLHQQDLVGSDELQQQQQQQGFPVVLEVSDEARLADEAETCVLDQHDEGADPIIDAHHEGSVRVDFDSPVRVAETIRFSPVEEEEEGRSSAVAPSVPPAILCVNQTRPPLEGSSVAFVHSAASEQDESENIELSSGIDLWKGYSSTERNIHDPTLEPPVPDLTAIPPIAGYSSCEKGKRTAAKASDEAEEEDSKLPYQPAPSGEDYSSLPFGGETHASPVPDPTNVPPFASLPEADAYAGMATHQELVPQGPVIASQPASLMPDRRFEPPEEETRLAKRSRKRSRDLYAWYNRLNELDQFFVVHGHCDVPQTYPMNQPLANWVAKQRRQKKLFDANKKSCLTEHRVSLLDGMGFTWQMGLRGDDSWMGHYEELVAFHGVTGHSDYPTRGADHPPLGRWVTEQRKRYKMAKQGKMSAEDLELWNVQESLLNSINFSWALQREPSSDAAQHDETAVDNDNETVSSKKKRHKRTMKDPPAGERDCDKSG